MSALGAIASLLASAGIEPALTAPAALAPLAEERRRTRGLRDLDAYAALLGSDATELAALLRLVAVPETWAYRYPASFEWLRGFVAGRSGRPFRALSVASATGAEAATIAAAALSSGVPPTAVSVLGIDPNMEAVEAAREARFGALALRGGLPPWAAPWLSADRDGRLQADPAVRACTAFRVGSAPEALRDLPTGGFDAVFCRNLAIYLSEAPRRAIGAELDRLLAPDGALLLGHAERPSHFGLERSLASACPDDPSAFAFVRQSERQAPHDGPRPAPASRAAPARTPAVATAPSPAAMAPVPVAEARPTLEDARAAADRGQLQAALEIAERLRRAGDARPGLLELLGSVHMALGNDARAEELLRQVVYLDPSNPEALLQLGMLAERRGDAAMSARYRARAAGGRP